MNDIGEALRTYLAADANVAAIVTSRIYADVLPQSATLPAVAYWLSSTDTMESLNAITDVASASFTVDCFAATRAAVVTLAETVRLVLQANTARTAWGSMTVLGCSFAAGISYDFDAAETGSDQRRWRATQDVQVFYRQATTLGD